MSEITLLCAGSVYLVNGLVLLGRIDARGGAVLNIIISALLALAAAVSLQAGTEGAAAMPDPSLLAALGFILFAITFALVGVGTLLGTPGAAAGWFCGWCAPIALLLAVIHATLRGDPASALLWSVWTVAFGAFFAVLGLGLERATRSVGVFAIATGFSTCVVLAVLMIIGSWNTTPLWAIAMLELGTIAILPGSVLVARSRNRAVPAGA